MSRSICRFSFWILSTWLLNLACGADVGCENNKCQNGATCVAVGIDYKCNCVVYDDYFYYGTLCTSVSCGGVVQVGQNFTSPGYQESQSLNSTQPWDQDGPYRNSTPLGPYPNNADCDWRIFDSEAEPLEGPITVVFGRIELSNPSGTECGKGDYLDIRDNGKIIAGPYCDDTMPTAFVFFNGSRPSVHFHSDGSGTGAGFIAEVTEKSGCDAITCLNGGNCSISSQVAQCTCPEPFSGIQCERSDSACMSPVNGSFSSPQYPEEFVGGTECQYKLEADEGNRLVVTFNNVDFDDGDYIEVYDGPDTNSFQFSGTLHKVTTRTYKSSSNYMTILLKSAKNIGGKHPGFQASYTQENTQPLNFERISGVINSNLTIDTTKYFLHNYEFVYNVTNPDPTRYTSVRFIIKSIHLSSGGYGCWANFLETKGLYKDQRYCGDLENYQDFSISGIEQFQLKLHIGENDARRPQYFIVRFEFLSSRSVSCGFYAVKPNSTFTSPGFLHGQYPSNVDCSWTISDNDGNTLEKPVTLLFDRLQFNNPSQSSCGSSYLEIKDGDFVAGPYCDASMPSAISFSAGSKPLLHLHSSYDTGVGFSAQVTQKSGCDAVRCLNGGTCRVKFAMTYCICVKPFGGVQCEKPLIPTECSKSFSLTGIGDGDVFQSFLYPDGCGAYESCEYNFDAGEQGYLVQLEFLDNKNSNCDSGDFLKIYDNGVLMTDVDYCGTLISSSTKLSVEWASQGQFSPHCGFKAKFTKVKKDNCRGVVCQHGGTCIDQINGFQCSCQLYYGPYCEYYMYPCHLATAICLNGGSCAPNKDDGNIQCQCANGYSGTNCETKSPT